MKFAKNKTMATLITLILMLTITIPLMALPDTQGATTNRTKKTYAVVGIMPNPVGVGQETLVWLGITDYVENQSQGWKGLTVTVTKPDGTIELLNNGGLGFTTDATGSTGTVYVPDTAGNYTFQTHFPAQWFNWSTSPMFDPEIYGNILYQASDSDKITLTVTSEPVKDYPNTALPTEYWSRPINGQLYTWNTISANWLSRPVNTYAPNNDNAPETGHILWAKPLSLGGLAGGFTGDHNEETGDAYEGKFANTVVINGIMFYNRYAQGLFGGSWNQQGIYAVDIRTGEELWFKNNSRLAFGQTLYWDSFNMHGVFSYIYETVTTYVPPTFAPVTTWKAYDPLTGEYQFSIKNIPTSGIMFGPSFTLTGANGEFIIYNIDLAHGWVAKWNSTTAVLGPHAPGEMAAGSWGSAANTQQTFDGNRGYDWNKTLAAGANAFPGSVAVVVDDRVIGTTTGGWTSIGDNPVGIWAFSLVSTGNTALPTLYNTTWAPPAGDLTVSFGYASLADKVFTMETKETRAIYGFNMDTGQQIWGPTESEALLQVFGMTGGIAYGRLFSTGYGGILYSYNVTTGNLLWQYAANDSYNEILWSNEWPLFIAFIADGKVYLQSNEHSPTNPLARGSPFVAVDVETGQRVWELPIWGTSWGGAPIIADSIIAQFNSYDNRIYAIGKGPSALTVNAPDNGLNLGSSIIIHGTVTDISSGTTQDEQAARFPNGVAAVSDASQSAWMEYVYMQKPKPTDVTGVTVSIDVVDANGNYRNIGNTTSDASGMFSFTWKPDIDGTYYVIATFAGSESYWPSSAETSFVVDPAAATPAPTAQALQSTADMYFVPAIAGIIVAIIIVGAVLALLMLKKRP